MKDSPRSSKRRKLDTPPSKEVSPVVQGSSRKASTRVASRSIPRFSRNEEIPETEDEAMVPTPARRLLPSRNPKMVSSDTLVDIRNKEGRVMEKKDVYDDIEGALPDYSESPEPSIVSRPKSSRKTSTLPPTSKRNTGTSTPSRSRYNSNVNMDTASRPSSKNVANNHNHDRDSEKNNQDDSAIIMPTPSRKTLKVGTLKGKIEDPVANGSKKAGVRSARKIVTGTHDNRESSELQAEDQISITPSRPRSMRKAASSTTLRRQAAAAKDHHDDADVAAATPSTTSRRRNRIHSSEEGAEDRYTLIRSKAVKARRLTNRADHISNREEASSVDEDEPNWNAAIANGQDEELMDVDGDSALGSVLDPTEPSPFNKPSPATKPVNQKRDPTAFPLSNLKPGRELDLLKSIVMDQILAKRPVPLVELEEEYKLVHQLVEQTITAGEGNSMLVIGARGSGKTSLVNKVLAEISKDNSEDYHVVRLNGFIHTDDKIALREIWRQLGKEMDIEEDGGLSKNYADTLTTLLGLLSHPSEQTGEHTDQVAKAVIFVMDEFDLFAHHPRQTLLYNLFDIAQSRKAPIAVLGLTTRIDVANSLEKRVKSRFSHRYVHLSLAKTFSSFQEICKASLSVQSDQLSVEQRAILGPSHLTPGKKNKKTPNPTFLADWNTTISTLFSSKTFLTEYLAPYFYRTKSVPSVLSSFLLATAALSFDSSSIESTALLSPPDSKLSLLSDLSTLALALLISAARLDIIHDSDSCNFNMAYDEYVTLASKARIQSAAGGATASGVVSKVWGKEVARREWEELIELGLIMPVVGGITGGFGMVRCDVALEEIGAVLQGRKDVEKALERWCRQL